MRRDERWYPFFRGIGAYDDVAHRLRRYRIRLRRYKIVRSYRIVRSVGLYARRSKTLPESETKRYKLLGGELVEVASPTEYHQRISGNLELILRQFVQEKELGRVYHAPLDVVLREGDEREVVQPDIFFVSKERSQIIAEEEIRGALDLVIEITSPAAGSKNTGSWILMGKLSKSTP